MQTCKRRRREGEGEEGRRRERRMRMRMKRKPVKVYLSQYESLCLRYSYCNWLLSYILSRNKSDIEPELQTFLDASFTRLITSHLSTMKLVFPGCCQPATGTHYFKYFRIVNNVMYEALLPTDRRANIINNGIWKLSHQRESGHPDKSIIVFRKYTSTDRTYD